uniref:Uncharacterized protein n=1 Tax=Coccidioides posadasii RMSCC 3488 TaxID=454284 RepID=A0A0J6FH79_COCPO|nr:hypothetical protein CPAG_08796 [Coccidioides posadasii RMSCC 3488]
MGVVTGRFLQDGRYQEQKATAISGSPHNVRMKDARSDGWAIQFTLATKSKAWRVNISLVYPVLTLSMHNSERQKGGQHKYKGCQRQEVKAEPGYKSRVMKKRTDIRLKSSFWHRFLD